MRTAAVLVLLALSPGCSTSSPTSTTTAPSGGSSPSGGNTVTCSTKTYSPSLGATGSFGPDDSKDCRGPADVPGDQYTMTLTGQTDIDLTLTPSGLSAVLAVYTENNTRLFRLAGAGVVHQKLFLPAGGYKIAIGRTNSVAGTYTLTSPPATLDSCPAQLSWGLTLVGATITGTVTDSDCGGGSVRTDVYVVPLAAGQTLNLPFTADKFTYVEASADGPDSKLLLSNYIPKSTPTTQSFTAPAAGSYRVAVAYPGPGSGGSSLPINYTFSLK